MKGQTNRSILQPKLQRRLRNAATDAERLLWQHLRAQQLDGCKFRRQHPFGNYILDFVCLGRKLVVELDGSQHADRTGEDAARSLPLERAGFQILRFWNNQVFEDVEGVLEVIWKALRARAQTHPRLGPPLEGEREQRDDAPREGEGEKRARVVTHPHPNPPLEGEGD